MTASATHALAELVGRFAGLRIWVAGDLMLDEALSGEASRISPEAPVPVVHVRDRSSSLGGAGNVARNLAALGARVELCGVVGNDAAGDEVIDLARSQGMGVGAVGRLDRETTRKVRLLTHRQQIARMDFENRAPVPADVADGLLARLAAEPRPQAVIASDYAKGFLTPGALGRLFALAREAGCPALVDPKGPDFDRYRGATLLKPNLAELGLALGRQILPDDARSLEEGARDLARKAGARAVVITLGDRGMVLVEEGRPLILVPATRREVYDVTGAGDTAMAALGLGIAAGASLEQAAELANAAAGIVVGRMGTAAPEPWELRAAVNPPPAGKILDPVELAARAAAWRSAGRKVVFTNGCFDLLHAGHLSLLRAAASLGEVLVVAVNSDASVRRLKGAGRPVVPQAERLEILAALQSVTAVVAFDEDTPLRILETVRPEVLVKGGDYGLDQVVGRREVESWGGRVVLVPLLEHHSTSGMVRRIAGRS
jgi:D-beta-D-heptose 7-phosphate kinase/D-beta-D-heptose 1-phosphate adenosyltransferase